MANLSLTNPSNKILYEMMIKDHSEFKDDMEVDQKPCSFSFSKIVKSKATTRSMLIANYNTKILDNISESAEDKDTQD